MTIEWFSYTNVSRPIDFNRFTPDAVLRASQQVLGVTADGVFGEGTRTALVNYLTRQKSSAPTAQNWDQLISQVRALRPGETISRQVWSLLASLGLQRMGFPLSADNPITIGGADPMFARPRAAAPAPRPTTPAAPRPTTPAAPSSPTVSPANLAGSIGEFASKYKVPIIVGGVALAGVIGALVYMSSQDEEDDGEGDRGVRRSPLEEQADRRQLPPPSPPISRELDRRHPMYSDDDSSLSRREDLRSSATMLGVRPDADVSSIRAAYAREAGKYPLGDRDAYSKREQLREARDRMLRAHGAR